MRRCHLLLAHVAEDLVVVLLAVSSATYMDPIVASVGGFHDQLVKVCVMLQEGEPLFGEFHVGVALVVIPVGIGGLGDVDVGCFTKGVLAGVCATDFDVKLRTMKPKWW